MIFLTYIFIALAAVCNAFMDKVENENFYQSVFKHLNPQFWYKRVSWQYAKKLFGYKFDAWHLAKSAMIVFWALAVVFYHPFIPIIDFVVIGIIHNIIFNLFYNHIFKTT